MADSQTDTGAAEQQQPKGVLPVIRRGLSRTPLWLAGLLVAAVGAVITQTATDWMGSLGSAVSDRVVGEPAPLTLDGEVVRAAWARERGGVDANSTGFQVVIQGTSTSSVVLKGLTIRVLARRPPPRGTLVEPIGAGGAPARYFTVDLDAPAPRATFDFGETSGREERPIDFPYQVSESEPEVFFIFASAHRCDCTWVAELAWSAKGKSGVATIDDDGEPFRTVSGEAATAYRASDDGRLEQVPGT